MDNLLLPNKIIRTQRKSISLIVQADGEFIVRAPLKCSDKKIYKFINEKSNWIIKKRTAKQTNPLTEIVIKTGITISILGNTYKIELQDAKRAKLLNDKVIIPTVNSKENLILLLKRLAKKHFQSRVGILAKSYNFNYTKISISSAKTCWGSCSYNNNLHFTYKLVLCPLAIIDYIIIHELCHTKIKNHSKQFWSLIESIIPNYKICVKWLKDNGGIVNMV